MQNRNKTTPNLPNVQCRRLPVGAQNFRFIEKDNKTGVVKVSGYAVKWESVNYYSEQFVRGAFAEVCAAFLAKTKHVHVYYNHGWRLWYVDARLAMRVGKITTLKEDDTGLYLEIEFTPGLSIADDVAAMIRHGTVDGFSIAFYPVSDLDCENIGTHTLIKRADIYEISVVDDPADDAARVITDDSIDQLDNLADAEQMIRNILPGQKGENFLTRLKELSESNEKPNEKPYVSPLSFLDGR